MGMTAFTLDALIKLDDSQFKKSLSGAEGKMSSFGTKLSGIGSGIAKIGKVAAVAVTAASAAVGKIVMDSVNAYSDYEQLVGGVETLFGAGGRSLEEYQKKIGITEKSTAKQIEKSIADYHNLQQAQDNVMKNAHNAYMTAGLDANEYMETVTSFSAALLQGLKGDTVRAADVADMAITDMSDNANKMGTDMASIQNAYQGFAKQNYTMLDNLKLGYGGTRSEMQRLLKDAGKIAGKKFNLNNLADVYEAIHVIQTEMGITGTTAKEASTTIQGSTKMMKSAWNNLKIAIVDPKGNIGQAISDLTKSVKVAAKNWLPAIKQGLAGIGQLVRELAPVIAEELPGLISDILPGIAEAAVSLVTAIASTFVDNIGVFVQAAVEIFDAIIKVFKESDSPVFNFLGQILETIRSVLSTVMDLFKDFPGTVKKFKESDNVALQALGLALEAVKAVLDWIQENQGVVVGAIAAIVGAFAVSQIASFATSLNWVTLLIAAIGAAAGWIVTHWGEVQAFFETLWTAVQLAVQTAYDAVKQWWTNIKESLSAAWTTTAQWFENTVWNPIVEAFTTLWNTITQLWTNIKESISAAWTTIATWFEGTVWNPIVEAFTSLWNTITQLWTGTKEAISGAWTTIATWFEGTVWNPISEAFGTLWDTIVKLWTDISSNIETAWSAVESILSPIIEGIKAVFQGVVDVVNGIWDTLSNIFGLGDKTINVTINKKVTGTWEDGVGNLVTEFEDGSSMTDFSNTTGGTGAGRGGFAKGSWNIPHDMFAQLHRGEMVLTASQARKYREGQGTDVSSLYDTIVSAVRDGMANAQVNSYLDGQKVTDEINKIMGNELAAGRFA